MLLLGTGASLAADWVLKRVTGTVHVVAPGVAPERAKVGMTLPKGYTLATQANGRAMLERGPESIMVSPGTVFAVSAYRTNGAETTLLQKKGTLTLDIEKRARPHFAVETPFFAAVVKGTRFTVEVARKSGRVTVERGVVGVSDFASGDSTDLAAGQFAATNPETKVGLSVGGKGMPVVSKGAPRAPLFDTPAVKNVPSAGSKAASSNAGGNSANASSNSSNSSSKGNSANSNAGGNSANANSNAGSGNSNAGGNSNGNGNSGNSNAGGNSNGNGNSGNSNAGGNGNGNSSSGDDDD